MGGGQPCVVSGPMAAVMLAHSPSPLQQIARVDAGSQPPCGQFSRQALAQELVSRLLARLGNPSVDTPTKRAVVRALAALAAGKNEDAAAVRRAIGDTKPAWAVKKGVL